MSTAKTQSYFNLVKLINLVSYSFYMTHWHSLLNKQTFSLILISIQTKSFNQQIVTQELWQRQLFEPDYKNQFFQHSELTRIQGEPTTASLINLQNEVKSNAASVHTTLGGGNHDHNTAAYERPDHHGALDIPTNATQFHIANLREKHHANLPLFDEVNAVKRNLLQ